MSKASKLITMDLWDSSIAMALKVFPSLQEVFGSMENRHFVEELDRQAKRDGLNPLLDNVIWHEIERPRRYNIVNGGLKEVKYHKSNKNHYMTAPLEEAFIGTKTDPQQIKIIFRRVAQDLGLVTCNPNG